MKKHSNNTRTSQGPREKPLYELHLPHPKLMCNIAPDVRPFEWPRRVRKRREMTLEMSLFDIDLAKFFRDLDNYGESNGQD